MFSLANFQASFPSQIFLKKSDGECSWQKFLESTKGPLSDILKCYYKLIENGNIKPAPSVNSGLLHRHFTSF